jgi:hypothetical protein
MKHTPGPWTLSFDEKKVGTISGETRGWGEDHLVTGLSCGANPSGFSEELLANARLIAAAPEMHEELTEAWACIEHLSQYAPKGMVDDIKETLERIHRVLVKAEGEPLTLKTK